MPQYTIIKYPGPVQLQDGGYEVQTVDGDALDQAQADGWSLTKEDARAAYDAAQSSPDVVVETAPPTRAELEQKAGELGIKFDGRTSDKSLAGKIADALKA